jgi:8-oxo-dGTP pyrophosphatase MutT (NUDIX family)
LNYFTAALEEQLRAPLPGRETQFRMAPYRRPEDLNFKFPESAKRSSVLASYFIRDSEPCFVLMKRSEDKGVHSRQICFPGGALEKEDASLLDTAIRESNEEIGLKPELIQILGPLSPLYIPVSNFFVQPYMAFLISKPEYLLDPQEAAGVLEISLSELMDDNNEDFRLVDHRGEFTLKTPCFVFEDEVVWGATAMMIAEMKAIISQMGH